MLRRPDFVLPLAVLELIRQGLLKAVFWHLTDCSARYATRFREGLFAISMVRSLAAAGEKVEDYFAHLRAVVKAFTNRRFSIDDCRPESVSPESIGPESLRPESTGPQSDRRELSRSSTPDLGLNDRGLNDSAADNRQSSIVNLQFSGPELPAPNPEAHPPLLLTLSTALAQITWRRLRASRRHADGERRAVVHLFRKLAAERRRGETVTHARLIELAEDLHRVLFYSAGRFQRRLERLNHRCEAIAARILKELGAPPPAVHVRPSPAVDKAWAGSLPEVLANPSAVSRQRTK